MFFRCATISICSNVDIDRTPELLASLQQSSSTCVLDGISLNSPGTGRARKLERQPSGHMVVWYVPTGAVQSLEDGIKRRASAHGNLQYTGVKIAPHRADPRMNKYGDPPGTMDTMKHPE